MDALLNFYEKNSVYVNLYRDKHDSIIQAKKYVNENSKLKIYINNFYEKEMDEEIYIFDENIFLRIKFMIKDSSLKTEYTVFKYSKIENIELVKDTGYEMETILKIVFKNEVIEMSNDEKFEINEYNDIKKGINSKLLEGIFEFLISKL